MNLLFFMSLSKIENFLLADKEGFFKVLFTLLENAAFALRFALLESFAACLAFANALFFLFNNLVTNSGLEFCSFKAFK